MNEGDVLAGRFEIVRFISRGGMGDVYEVHDLQLGSRVALKIIRGDLAEDPAARKRFIREVNLSRQVTHRNVCRIFDVFTHRATDADGVESEVLGLTMELLEGESLADLLLRDGTMSPEQALPLIAQMAAALTAAHASGVIHRDFKTGNVMLVPNGGSGGSARVVVTDFGLARPVHRLAGESTPTEQHLAVGTVDYMAPEQAEGRELTPACDIYALGVVIFEMVTGDRPHSAESPIALLLSRVRERTPSPRTLVPDLDDEWERAILRCLEYEPSNRYRTPLDVVAALDVDGETETLAPEVVAAAGGHRPGKRRLRGRLLLVVLVLAAVAATLLWSRWRVRTTAPSHLANAVQLTTWPALEIDPSISPDGAAIAFSCNRHGSFEIFVASLAPVSRERQLTMDGEQNFQPEWSPDGELIAYASHGRGGIWLIPATGGTPHQLTDFGSHPCWSGDGSVIAFQSDETAELSANACPATPPSTLWVVDAEDGATRQVTRAGDPVGGHGQPVWSADGERLIFIASDRRWAQIWHVEAGGGAPRALVTDLPSAFDPVTGALGKHLYYSAISERERYGVWRLPIVRTTVERKGPPEAVLSPGAASLRNFDLSTDGGRMVYSALETVSNLWSVPVSASDGSVVAEPVALTTGTGRNSRPVFSPNGAAVAFNRWHVGRNEDIWLLQLEGGDLRQMTVHPAVDTLASWMPDGETVLFCSERDGGLSLWSSLVDGSRQQVMAKLGREVDFVRLSPDGQRIAFQWTSADRSTNIWVAQADGGEARQLTFDDQLMGYPAWSPDGSLIAFEMKRGDDDHLMVMPSAGGEPVQLTFEPGKSWPFSWSPDGDKIAFSGLRDGRWNIYWVSRTTGEQRQLTFLDRLAVYVRYPSWSPRGDQIVFELAESTGDLWLIEGLR